ncbi:MAG: protein kinase [Pirellulaceae bacterium]
MSEFDPYYHWLGITPKDQPPNHYRLLGIDRFEEHVEVISNAADRQMMFLRSFQSGRHALASQQLLNELAAARVCLLDPERKAAYDSRLREGSERSDDEHDIERQAAAFGEYVLVDHLASDASGQIFKAEHRRMDRVVAIKVLSSQAVTSPEAVNRFLRKTKILARLSHPNLVSAYDAGERDGIYYLIMEYVDGCDLLELMKRHTTLPLRHVVDYMLQSAMGLGFAHQHGIVHRNVKPSNLLVDNNGIVKVIGMGLALFRDEQSLAEASEKGRVLGTIDYMALEQAIDCTSVDARADIYSLGCTMYTALTRKLPFPMESPKEKLLAHRDAPIPSIRAQRDDAPEILDEVLQRMMAKRPEQRFQSMEEVVQALQAVEKVLLGGAASLPGATQPGAAQPGAASPDAALPTAAPVDPSKAAPAPPQSQTTAPTGEELNSFLSGLAEDEPHWKRRK